MNQYDKKFKIKKLINMFNLFNRLKLKSMFSVAFDFYFSIQDFFSLLRFLLCS